MLFSTSNYGWGKFLAPSLKEVYTKVLNNLTNEYRDLSSEEIRDKHCIKRGFSSYDDLLASLVDSSNPELAISAIKISELSSDEIINKFIAIIQNENMRADVREAAIRKLSEQKKTDVLVAISELVDDETLIMHKDYVLQFDEEFPLAEHPYILLFRKGVEKWYDTKGKKYTIAKVALDTLKETTKKDFGKDKKAWRKWIKANVK